MRSGISAALPRVWPNGGSREGAGAAARFPNSERKDIPMALKVFHCADLHLDAPFSLFTPGRGRSPAHRAAQRVHIRRPVRTVKRRGYFPHLRRPVRRDCVTRDTCELLAGQFASFPTCGFFISPGNHDPYNDASVYKRMEWPDNVHIFTGEKERVRLDELGVDVYGVGFTGKTCLSSPGGRLSGA